MHILIVVQIGKFWADLEYFSNNSFRNDLYLVHLIEKLILSSSTFW